MCHKSTAHEQRRSRGESRKLRFGSNRKAPKIWKEGQHDLHTPPQPIDWREHTIGAVHDRNLPTRSLQLQEPESYENFLWHRVKVRSIVTGLRHDDERDDDRSRRRVSIMSSLDVNWRGLIPADHEYLDSVAWPCHDCEVAPVWHHDVTNARTCQFSAVCLTVFPFEFRPRTFTIGFYGKNSIISELMILECSFPLKTQFHTLQLHIHKQDSKLKSWLVDIATGHLQPVTSKALTWTCNAEDCRSPLVQEVLHNMKWTTPPRMTETHMHRHKDASVQKVKIENQYFSHHKELIFGVESPCITQAYLAKLTSGMHKTNTLHV